MTTPRLGLTFTHVGFFAHDIDRQADFYKSVLDFTETDRGTLPGPDGPLRLIFLSRDPAEHHQIVLVSSRPEQVNFNVINQISMKADSLQTLIDFHDRVKAVGVDELRPVTHGNALSVYFRDPEGNRVELYWDLPWYVSQPARVPAPFDLDAAGLLAWAESHARTLPGFRPRSDWTLDMARRMGIPQDPQHPHDHDKSSP